jgi:hypothetical protein
MISDQTNHKHYNTSLVIHNCTGSKLKRNWTEHQQKKKKELNKQYKKHLLASPFIFSENSLKTLKRRFPEHALAESNRKLELEACHSIKKKKKKNP